MGGIVPLSLLSLTYCGCYDVLISSVMFCLLWHFLGSSETLQLLSLLTCPAEIEALDSSGNNVINYTHKGIRGNFLGS